jgi:hypothetical protein
MILTREQILASKGKRTIEPLEVPELGGSVFVRELMGDEREAVLAKRLPDGKVDPTGLTARLLVVAVCDEDGNPMFQPSDEAALSGIPAKALERIFTVAERLSVLDSETRKKLEGNSGSGQTKDSTTV